MTLGLCVVVFVLSHTGDELVTITLAVFPCGYTDVVIFLIGDDGSGPKKKAFAFALWIGGMIFCRQMRGGAFNGSVLRGLRGVVYFDTWVVCYIHDRSNRRVFPEANQSNGNDIWLERASKTHTAAGCRTLNLQMLRPRLVIYCFGLVVSLKTPKQLLPRVLASVRLMPCKPLTVRNEQH